MLIHAYRNKWKMAQGRPAAYCFGGSSKSDSSTSTTNHISNNTDYNDKRAVAQDEAISLGGDNNVVNRSTSNLTSFIDTSNRSTSSTTQFTDNSNRSTSSNTTFTDTSDRSVNYTTTDQGAVAAGLGLGAKALDTVGATTKSAFDSLIAMSDNGLKATHAAFDLAKSSGANSMANSAAVLGFAQDTIKQTRAAFQEAEDGGNKQIMLYAVVAVAVVGVAMALRR